MIKFGTDGWRAVMGEEFTFENVACVIQAYADLVRHELPLKQPIPLGFDRRLHSREFAEKVASVLAANGLPVLMSQDYCPTPCISWMTKSTGAINGIMITASHNPAQWNGVKFKESYGGSAAPAFTSQIEAQIEKNNGKTPKEIPFDEAVRKKFVTFFDPHQGYVDQLHSCIDLKAIRKANFKIAYDPLYGAGAGFLSKVLKSPIQEIHFDPDPSFGGLNPEPIEQNLKALITLVQKEKCDVGLATDGDADRIGAVDENGKFVNSHQIYALLLRHLLSKGLRGGIVKTVTTTQMIDRIAAQHHLAVYELPVGFKHICQKFRELDSQGGPLIGGEESGGIAIPSHVYERDGLLCGLLLLEIMAQSDKRLGELLNDLEKEIGPFHFKRVDFHLSANELERLRKGDGLTDISKIGGMKVARLNALDGFKYLLEDESWLLIRVSGTEPLVRVYAEGPSEAHVEKLISEGRSLLKLV